MTWKNKWGNAKQRDIKISYIILEEEESVQGGEPWRRPNALEASRMRKKLGSNLRV
jgi:hypothetical protein